MGVYQRPKSFKKRFEFVGDLFPALIDRRAQRAGSLSGGERQMVAMGRALMMEPSVLLLDEPSAGLSPVMQDEVFVQTRRINRAGVSVVMVEQNAKRCLQICDRGYVLDQGRNAYTASGQDLINDPKVIELYLGTLAEEGLRPAPFSCHSPAQHEGARPGGRAPSLCCVDQMTPVTYLRFLYVLVGVVLEDADGGLGRATGVAQVARTRDTLVVDVLAAVQQARSTP